MILEGLLGLIISFAGGGDKTAGDPAGLVLKGILTILAILILLTFAFVIGTQNEAYITVNYLIAQANMRVSTLIAIALSLGVLVGILIMSASWLRLRVQLLSANSKINSLKKEH